MDFYSFSFGEMKVAQADADSPEVIALDVQLALKDPGTKMVHLLTVHVQVPGGANRTITDIQKDAFHTAQQVFQAAADYCKSKTPDQLKAESEKQLIATNKPT